MTQASRVLGATLGLLLLSVVLSACGGTPVAQNWPGLTLAGDTIYVISGTPHQVYMLDAETGEQKGTFVAPGELKGAVWWSPVTVGGGLAFVGFAESGSQTAALYAFEPETGQVLWNIPAEGLILPAPVYVNGTVYFGASDGSLYAVDVEAKRIKPGWPFQAEEAIWGSPLVVDDRLYLAAMDHHIYCLDAETGAEIWKRKFGGAMAAQPTLNAANGILYLGAFDGKVHAVDAETGELAEGFDFQVIDPETGEPRGKAGNWFWSKVLTVNDQLYATSLDGWLYALDPTTGGMIPSNSYDSGEIDDKQDTLRASPVQSERFIVVAAESGRVIAVENGRQQWVWPSGTPQASILTTPVVNAGTIYVVLTDGKVQALDAETGGTGWTFVPPESD